MKHTKKILSVLVALAMVLALTACGTQSSDAASAEGTSASMAMSAKDSVEEPKETKTEEAPQNASAEDSVETVAYSVEYPLDTDVSLSVVAKLESHMQSIIENYGDVLAMQRYMEDTGVQVEFQMLGDMVFDEQLNLLISAEDLPDLVQGGMAGYGMKLSAAIDDEVLMDIAPLLPEYAPDYYAYIQQDIRI